MTDALLVGGTSEIGLAIVRRLGAERVWLLGRDEAGLARVAADFDGPTVEVGLVDADDVDAHRAAIARAFDEADGFDMVVIAVGVLGAQAGLDADPREAIEVMRVNFLGAGSLLLESLRQMRRRGKGTLILLSSVAAERPRASNTIYGAAKAGLDALAQGLADAIASSGVRVLVVRPGFVKSRMTARLDPAPFATTPEAVAIATVAALRGRANTVWVPGRLRLIFAILRHLPRSVYRRLPL
ncbi:MAG TPA: SDR family NAD(P)-dependent oxidoreductase [Solirubrobacteraceae bacterium]|nr:SDR family NAD(P)-dependent oxidoreductase [Solirubrobacteraceae bacterium]